MEEVEHLAGVVGNIDAVFGTAFDGTGVRNADNAGKIKVEVFGVESEKNIACSDKNVAGRWGGEVCEGGEQEVEKGSRVSVKGGAWQGGKNLALGGVGDESSTVAAGVDDEDALVVEKLGQRFGARILF